jgi:N-acetylmuramic acid 6-phosphate etherase
MQPDEKILGVEGGGTKTAWVLVQHQADEFCVLEQGRLPPSNLRLTSPERLREIFAEFPRTVDRAGIFLAGCVTDQDHEVLSALCRERWPNAKILTGSDRDSGLAAGLGHSDGIVVNAGSGSSVTGRRDTRLEKAGGWGHILGDAGGAYFLSVQALRLILREYDLRRGEMQFTARVLQALSLNNLDELVRWAQTADKMEIALLAPVVFEAAGKGDQHVMEILEEGARALSEYTEAVASRLHLLAPKVMLIGGLFQRDSIYAHAFRRRLKKNLPDARVATSERAPEMGAAWLASEMHDLPRMRRDPEREKIDDLAASLTEQRNPLSQDLETLTVPELVRLFVDQESEVQEALRRAAKELARAIAMVKSGLQQGGRLFYIGAGSSGRLGVLDASEIPPTFGAALDLVQGIIAGGATALYRSVEGAEDDQGAGALAIVERGIKSGDTVIGISASGRTPFVMGALRRAKEKGAATILLSCNPDGPTTIESDLLVPLGVGPEILTGSTRLKAGTATKIALNIISTGTMVALGKVRGNLMIDLQTTNSKLRDRAVRVVAELTATDYQTARAKLEANNWNLRAVIGDTPA